MQNLQGLSQTKATGLLYIDTMDILFWNKHFRMAIRPQCMYIILFHKSGFMD